MRIRFHVLTAYASLGSETHEMARRFYSHNGPVGRTGGQIPHFAQSGVRVQRSGKSNQKLARYGCYIQYRRMAAAEIECRMQDR